MGRCRLALTISGAVALGAYEAGALAALLVGVQRLLREPDPPVQVDVMAGASAGSITALLAARTLLNGYDPVHVMEEAWVRTPQVERLLQGAGTAAPLSLDGLQRRATGLLSPGPGHEVGVVQEVPIAVHMTLANLHGLQYRIPVVDGGPRPAIPATTYLDWGRFTLQPRDPVEAYTEPAAASPVAVALASGANAVGFPPRLLNRRQRSARQDADGYEDNAILNLPEDGLLWYTDGGTVDNQPIGRALELVHRVDAGSGTWSARPAESERLMVLVHPHPTAAGPTDDSPWAGRSRPAWLKTLARAYQLHTTQTLFADVFTMQRTNSRLVWANRLHNALAAELGRLSGEDADRWRHALQGVLDSIEADRSTIRAVSGRPAREADTAELSLEELLVEVLQATTGLAGKSVVSVTEITPERLLTGDVRVEDLLAGEFLSRFGGFLHEPLRRRDFDLGYRSTLEWMRDGGLTGHDGRGLSPQHVELALSAAVERYQPAPLVVERGRPDLPLRAHVAAARVLTRAAGIAVWERLRG